jgi:hypothetical protein
VESQAVRGERQIVFQRKLSELTDQRQREHMASLVARIEEQGKKLAERADLAELERYRSLVKGFMDEVVSGGYEFTKENTYAARGKHRLIATVRTVNAELDQLAKDVLSKQADNLSILERTGVILGLLLDMMV